MVLAAIDPAFDQAGFFQDFHVFGDRRRADGKRLGQLSNGSRTLGQKRSLAESKGPGSVAALPSSIVTLSVGTEGVQETA